MHVDPGQRSRGSAVECPHEHGATIGRPGQNLEALVRGLHLGVDVRPELALRHHVEEAQRKPVGERRNRGAVRPDEGRGWWHGVGAGAGGAVESAHELTGRRIPQAELTRDVRRDDEPAVIRERHRQDVPQDANATRDRRMVAVHADELERALCGAERDPTPGVVGGPGGD